MVWVGAAPAAGLLVASDDTLWLCAPLQGCCWAVAGAMGAVQGACCSSSSHAASARAAAAAAGPAGACRLRPGRWRANTAALAAAAAVPPGRWQQQPSHSSSNRSGMRTSNAAAAGAAAPGAADAWGWSGELSAVVQPRGCGCRRPIACSHAPPAPCCQVNERYPPQLAAVLSFPQSVGIVGGRPGSSLFFVGVQGGGAVLYLDPHDVQDVSQECWWLW
jgi:hypothetical protein